MENNQVRLDELKAELAYRHQLSNEEVSRIIDNVIIGFTGMTEQLKPLAEEMARRWGSLKEAFQEAFQENCEKTLWNTENEAMHGWDLDWDTRKRCQVILNKPKFMVRKIIR